MHYGVLLPSSQRFFWAWALFLLSRKAPNRKHCKRYVPL